ncbi:MAG: hypothetical protein MJ219_01750 [Mycoplasmoidaceae bacterium]|nr:hypothetical protein [Mycoplasmoidaceae bacterium]
MKDTNLEDLLGQMGDFGQLKDMLSAFKKPAENKAQPKKDEIPDDKKYKS